MFSDFKWEVWILFFEVIYEHNQKLFYILKTKDDSTLILKRIFLTFIPKTMPEVKKIL